MKMKLTSLLVAATCGVPLLVACAQANPAEKVSVADRAAVEQIVRDYILDNPEIIEEALIELAARERAKTAIALASDPRDFSIGPADAKVTIVEFFDYRCGFCKRSMDWVMDTAETHPDDIRVVFKELPILSEESRTAALAALAAGEQGKYMEMHQALMQSRSDFSDAAIDEIARTVGVDVKKMRADMGSRELLQQVADVREQAISVDAGATPTFFINGRVVAGYDEKTLDTIVSEELQR